ncbi:unnamed protein product [Blepharisma stoltei]|uniref:Leishmanolysin-like peptidase n=1 Tax=Blepharisma stoltei TaxID=1481888 RepID=A0AAU9J698_9CILI|nr:unnamed protein product [Blepharisma stoltei]
MLTGLLLSILLNLPFVFSGECHADEHRATPSKVMPAFSRKFDENNRLLLDRESDFEPIRIYVHYGELKVPLAAQKFIKTYVVDGAIKWFRKVLLINPVIGRLTFPGFSGRDCGGFKIPREHATVGVNADVVIYLTAGDNDTGLAGWAITCLVEKGLGYPLASQLHLETVGLKNETFEDALSTVIHEMSHILAFSANLMDLWIKPDGSKYKNDEILLWGVERNKTVAKLKTPKVLAKAKEHFNCSELEGIGLEVSRVNGTLGSHWEKRIMNDDYMVPDFDIHDIGYSDISLAVFEDSGWYKVNYWILNKPIWGFHKGCEFLKEKCIVDNKPLPNEFCLNSTFSQCDYRHLRKGNCNLNQFHDMLPEPFQYFSNPCLGGKDEYIDYCPVVKPFYKGNCRETNPSMQDINQLYGEAMCESCRCIEGTYSKSMGSLEHHAICHNITCTADAAIIHIRNVSVTCPFTGGTVKAPGFHGFLVCPESDILCIEMPCLDNCSGRGKCIRGVCNCDNGVKGGACPGKRQNDTFSLNVTNKAIIAIIGILLLMIFL